MSLLDDSAELFIELIPVTLLVWHWSKSVGMSEASK